MRNKKHPSERDTCTKYITPAIELGWEKHTPVLEEASFTARKIYVRGKLTAIGKRTDYIIYCKPNTPIAIIEAKYNKQYVQTGIDALNDKYAVEGITNLESIEVLKVNPFNEFSSPSKYCGSLAARSGFWRR